MEKQPVDDLFARKLRDAEAPVGPDVFNQLQQRMGAKPLPARHEAVGDWWYLASAACLLIAFWFLFNTGTTQEPVNQPVAKRQPILKTAPGEKTGTGLAAQPQREQKGEDIDRRAVDRANRQIVAKATYPHRKASKPQSQQINAEIAQMEIQKPAKRMAEVQPADGQSVQNRPTMEANPALIAGNDRINIGPKKVAERTIILTINEPQVVTTSAIPKSEAATTDPKLQATGLSGLFGKLKQLKNGDVLAKASPGTNQPHQKNRFSRVFTEVKESLKNETTLD